MYIYLSKKKNQNIMVMLKKSSEDQRPMTKIMPSACSKGRYSSTFGQTEILKRQRQKSALFMEA